MRRCIRPASAGCECASIKPGVTVFPPRSILLVAAVARFSTSELLPTARNLSRRTATASARGSRSFTVRIFPLKRIRSGCSCSSGKSENALRAPRNSRRNIPWFIAILCNRGSRIERDRKSTRLYSSHGYISYAVFCLKKKKKKKKNKKNKEKEKIPKNKIKNIIKK